MKKNIILILLFFRIFKSYGQTNCECDFEISFPYLKSPGFFKLGHQTKTINKDTIIDINIISCRGASEFTIYKGKIPLLKGKTSNGLRLLTKQEIKIDIETIEDKVMIVDYYEALQESTWEYWSLNGEKIKEEIYKRGVKIH